jgi:hypothetical protein
MENIANDFGLALLGGEDLGNPIWGDVECIFNSAIGPSRNSVLMKN